MEGWGVVRNLAHNRRLSASSSHGPDDVHADIRKHLKRHSKASKHFFGKGRRKSKSAGDFQSSWSPIRQSLRRVTKAKNRLFTTISNAPALKGALTPSLVAELVKSVKTMTFEEGEMLFDEGDAGNGMYIILTGFVDILKRVTAEDLSLAHETLKRVRKEYDEASYELQVAQDSAAEDDSEYVRDKKKMVELKGNDLKRAQKAMDLAESPTDSQLKGYRKLVTVGQGEVIGETSLLTSAPRNAALVVSRNKGEGATCAFISRVLYDELCQKSGGKIQDKIMHARLDVTRRGLLDRVAVFRSIPEVTKRKILEVMRPVFHKAGDRITKQGAREYEFHIIIKGNVDVRISDETQASGTRSVRVLTSNEFFGEIALLNDEPRTATCVAETDDVVTMCLHKINFDAVITGELRARMQSASDAMRMGLLGNAFDDEETPDDAEEQNDAATGEGSKNKKQLGEAKGALLKRKESMAAMASDATNADQAALTAIKERGYSFVTDALGELETPLVQHRMPTIVSQITFDAGVDTKENIAEVFRNILSTVPQERTDEQIRFLMLVFKHTPFFKRYCASWAPHQTAELCRLMSFQYVKKSHVLYSVNQSANCAYVLLEGKLHEKSSRTKHGRTKGNALHTYDINVNDTAGEVALEGVHMRVATCVAVFDSDLLKVNAQDFVRINGVPANFYERFRSLKNSSVFKGWPDDRLGWLVHHMKEKHYPNDTVILKEGSVSQDLMFVLDGSVSLWQSFGGKQHSMTTLPVGGVFGAMPILLQASPELGRMFKGGVLEMTREASTAISKGRTKILCLPKAHFDKVIHSGYKTVDLIFQIIEARNQTFEALRNNFEKAKSIFEADIKFAKLKDELSRPSYAIDEITFPASPEHEAEGRSRTVPKARPLLPKASTYDKATNRFDRTENKYKDDPFFIYRKLRRYGMKTDVRRCLTASARECLDKVEGDKLPLLSGNSKWIQKSTDQPQMKHFHATMHETPNPLTHRAKTPDQRRTASRRRKGHEMIRAISPPTTSPAPRAKTIVEASDKPIRFPLSPTREQVVDTMYALTCAQNAQRKSAATIRSVSTEVDTTSLDWISEIEGIQGKVASPSSDWNFENSAKMSPCMLPLSTPVARTEPLRGTTPILPRQISSQSSMRTVRASSSAALLPSSQKVFITSDVLRPTTTMSVVTFEGWQSKPSHTKTFDVHYCAPALKLPSATAGERHARLLRLKEEQGKGNDRSSSPFHTHTHIVHGEV